MSERQITCAEADALRPRLRAFGGCTNYVGGEVLNWDLPAETATTWGDDVGRERMREVLNADGCRHYRIEYDDE